MLFKVQRTLISCQSVLYLEAVMSSQLTPPYVGAKWSLWSTQRWQEALDIIICWLLFLKTSLRVCAVSQHLAAKLINIYSSHPNQNCSKREIICLHAMQQFKWSCVIIFCTEEPCFCSLFMPVVPNFIIKLKPIEWTFYTYIDMMRVFFFLFFTFRSVFRSVLREKLNSLMSEFISSHEKKALVLIYFM